MYKTIVPSEVSVGVLQAYMQGAIAPRPIAFASTIDQNGNINLSPFSFFNLFSTKPPILIFSPARRARDNTTKHTLENALEVREVVINMVNFDLVEQASLASTEYGKGVNEFVKAGLTPLPSVLIKPPRVAESPVSFECKINQIVELGKEGGAGNLIICEVLLMHIKEEILDEKGMISPQKIDLVARLGGDWYCRANHEALFEIPKPILNKGIGIDKLPTHIRNSEVLTGNNLARLANIEYLPTLQDLEQIAIPNTLEESKHLVAKQLVEQGDLLAAWKVLLR
jgi:flavin reductase (DIM6/NTAB) family NADH-FMN oxidoreductase RutF